MICVDTSALMAVLMDEPDSARCRALLESQEIIISAGTLSEAYLVATAHRLDGELRNLIDEISAEVIEVTANSARRIGAVWGRWGKGRHPAALNFGDCFAYELASERQCPLLFVGNDFAKTDVISAL